MKTLVDAELEISELQRNSNQAVEIYCTSGELCEVSRDDGTRSESKNQLFDGWTCTIVTFEHLLLIRPMPRRGNQAFMN